VTKKAYTLRELEDVSPFSEQTFRRAVRKAKDDGQFPHPLTAHRDSKGRAIVLDTDFQVWLEALPDY
jgi:hypothetical protein